MKIVCSISLTVLTLMSAAQTIPKLYVNIVSHNEMVVTGQFPEPYDTNPAFFKATADTARKIADLVFAKGAKWNLETCQRFVFASIQQELAATTNTDVLQYCNMKGGVASSVVEIDPRYKTFAPTYTLDIADVAHMIDSTGAVASDNLGGFLQYNAGLGNPYSGEDWTQYQNATIAGAKYHIPWKAKIIWGPGSIPPHCHDANNFGVWQPTSGTDSLNLYTHTPSANNVWLQGNGCSTAVTDTTANVQWLVNYFRDVTTKIKNGSFPANKFYVASIFTNFKHYASAGFRQKLTTVIDSVNNMVSQGSIVWATISQKQAAFNAWTVSSGLAYSQWNCGQTTVAGIEENTLDNVSMFPNPAQNKLTLVLNNYNASNYNVSMTDINGKAVLNEKILGAISDINIQSLIDGIYFIKISNDISHSEYRKIIVSK